MIIKPLAFFVPLGRKFHSCLGAVVHAWGNIDLEQKLVQSIEEFRRIY
jgi:hypothetical protein